MGRKHRPTGLGSQSSGRLAPSDAAPRNVSSPAGPPSSPLPPESGPDEASKRNDAHDVSAAKAELSFRDEWLRLAFETSRDPLCIFDAQRRLLDCNRSACRIFARGRDELVGRPFAELADSLAEVSVDQLRLAPRAASDQWQLHGIEPVEASSPSDSSSGHVAAPSLPASDQGQGNLIEQLTFGASRSESGISELTSADLLVRHVIEALPVGVWVIDLAGSVVIDNWAGRQIWGDARNDWLRKGRWTSNGETITQDQWPGPRVLATGQAVSPTEVEVLTFDQLRKTLLISANPLRTEQGRLLGAVCVHQDITSRVTAERAAQLEIKRNVHLERLASIGTLAAGVAHEINNPLGTILLSAELALASLGEGNEDQRRALTSIVTDTKRCGRIVHNLLRFASRLATDRYPGDLNSVVRGVHRRIADYAFQRGVTLVVELTDSLPAVTMDAAAMEQAIMNVIRNAVDVSADTAEARVEIRTQVLSTAVRLAVRDYGPGVSPQDLPHLFDPFYTTRRSMGSVGLGLSVAHGIVRDHDGTLRIESTPGRGATLDLDLPIAAATGSDAATSALDSGQSPP